ncbi:hypothetical protein [Sphingomonas sp. NIBR02145]|uniref:DUF6916 family protein n=1 Tax=Sphingomonas sp. NIBR02145 TaxID=3014784 RepID=UPI0022B43E3E|nr:hypothetical protein [Sphingomonas sp. NIBR02145]WHU04202.1 hypothetical protein O3305_06330 [Sphingomonas sp. NIBR02145]
MTYSSRRSFVVGGVIAAGAGVAGCSGGGGSSSTGSVVTPVAEATPSGPVLTASEMSDWQKLLGSSFVITTPSGKVTATLASLEQIVDASRPTNLARHLGFFATFQMALGQVPAGQKTYQLSHATKGSFDLFLGMPGQSNGQGVITALLN